MCRSYEVDNSQCLNSTTNIPRADSADNAFGICEREQEAIMRLGLVIGFVLTTILVLAVSRNYNPYLLVLLLLPIFSLVGMYRAFTSSARKTKRDARSLEKTFITVLLRDAVVIDSAVWQDENRESFFKALAIILAAAGKKIVLYYCQYQELPGAAKAEIEQFQAQDIITLAPADISPAAAEEDCRRLPQSWPSTAQPAPHATWCWFRTAGN